MFFQDSSLREREQIYLQHRDSDSKKRRVILFFHRMKGFSVVLLEKNLDQLVHMLIFSPKKLEVKLTLIHFHISSTTDLRSFLLHINSHFSPFFLILFKMVLLKRFNFSLWRTYVLLKRLLIFNNEPQKSKQQTRTLITFPKLLHLDIDSTHLDYAEQFLFDQYCHLPCLLKLQIRYASPMMQLVSLAVN